jgi:2-phospho-L-lactate guanylyltransferase
MSRAPTIAIVPMKALAEAKTRLSPVLSPEARRRLVATMLADVLAALSASPGIDRVLVVTPDAGVAGLVWRSEADVLQETAPGDLNAALRLAVGQARELGAARVLIVPGDVPLATSAEIERLLAHAPRRGVVIAPSETGGTNALLLAPLDIIAPSFGVGSAERHRRLAEEARLEAVLELLPGLALDIDEAGDLAVLSRVPRYAWLADEIASAAAGQAAMACATASAGGDAR